MTKFKSNTSKRQANWYIINIVARHNQTPEHYVSALRKIAEEDPMCHIRGARFVSLGNIVDSQFKDNEIPCWLDLKLWSYDILDNDKFFSKEQKERVVMNLPSDIVANQAEEKVIFIPARHKAAVRYSGSISLKSILRFLQYALDQVEPGGFEVTTVKDKQVLDIICSSYSVIKFEAELFYSNDGHFSNFTQNFDSQIKKSNARRLKLSMEGSKEEPLSTQEGSLVKTAVELSEQDGRVIAKLKRTEHAPYENIDTKDHPARLSILADRNIPSADVHDAIKATYE